MKIDYLKEKKELVSIILLCVSGVLAVSILVKVTGFFTASARAEKIVKTAISQNTEDTNDIDKYFAKYKVLADALKKNNLFAPPPPKQHPVSEVLGIFGDEVIIRERLYKVGDKIGDAKIISIEPTQVTIEWDGKTKTFSPIDAGGSSGPDGPGGSRATARGGPPGAGGGSAQMVTVQSQARTGGPTGGPGGDMGGFGGFRGRFPMSDSDRDRIRSEMQERMERYRNMSEAERERFRAEMRERFGGRPPGGERGPGGGRRGGR